MKICVASHIFVSLFVFSPYFHLYAINDIHNEGNDLMHPPDMYTVSANENPLSDGSQEWKNDIDHLNDVIIPDPIARSNWLDYLVHKHFDDPNSNVNVDAKSERTSDPISMYGIFLPSHNNQSNITNGYVVGNRLNMHPTTTTNGSWLQKGNVNTYGNLYNGQNSYNDNWNVKFTNNSVCKQRHKQSFACTFVTCH